MVPNIESDYTLPLGIVFVFKEDDLTGFIHQKSYSSLGFRVESLGFRVYQGFQSCTPKVVPQKGFPKMALI